MYLTQTVSISWQCSHLFSKSSYPYHTCARVVPLGRGKVKKMGVKKPKEEQKSCNGGIPPSPTMIPTEKQEGTRVPRGTVMQVRIEM